jgi:phosphoribosylglycinamide formyltransferase 2
MPTLGTATTASATRILLLGSGELGKEVALEAQRFGVEVIACDRYANAPAMQIAHRSHVFPMLDAAKLREVVEAEKPDLIVPEIEAIATGELIRLEEEGFNVIPSARAALLTMDREGIRRLAAEELELLTSPYEFAETEEEYHSAVANVGLPCVVKPVMSSSGRGQSTLRTQEDVFLGWKHAREGARGGPGKVIVEGFVDFDYEITLLTVRHAGGTDFCSPVGHRQVDGDYHESWQPQPMTPLALERAQRMAKTITDNLGGNGLFGVELFVKGDTVYFSEVSPRPHDTGMVTMISQDLSEFALHARAILGLPIPAIRQHGPAASYVILGHGTSEAPTFGNLTEALNTPDTALRLFGKPTVDGERRLGVGLAIGATLDEARAKAKAVADAVEVRL